MSDAFLNHVKQLAAFDGHIEVWAAGPSCANTFSHQSGSSIIAPGGRRDSIGGLEGPEQALLRLHRES